MLLFWMKMHQRPWIFVQIVYEYLWIKKELSHVFLQSRRWYSKRRFFVFHFEFDFLQIALWRKIYFLIVYWMFQERNLHIKNRLRYWFRNRINNKLQFFSMDLIVIIFRLDLMDKKIKDIYQYIIVVVNLILY